MSVNRWLISCKNSLLQSIVQYKWCVVCVKLLPQESFPFSTILQETETLFYVFLQQFFVWFASINHTMNRLWKDK